MTRKRQFVAAMLVAGLAFLTACAGKDEPATAAAHPVAMASLAPAEPVSTPAAPPPTRGMIREAQTNLRQMGLYHGTVDGFAGPMTEAAVRQYQASRGLTATGQIDPVTFASLGPAGRSTTPPTAVAN